MKKTIIILIILSLALVCFAGCGTKSEGLPVSDEPTTETAEDDEAQTGRVHFSDIKYDPENGSIIFTIVNGTDETVTVGGVLLMEKKTIDGLWADLQPLEWNRDMVINGPILRIYIIEPGKTLDGDLNIGVIYGELSDGDYRATLQISSETRQETISGSFTVAPKK